RGGGGGPAAVGDGPHDGYRLGQAALSRAPARARRARAGEVEERGADLPARRLPRRLMRLDVNAFLGAYPWRHVPGTSPDALVRAMNRAGIDVAWASYLPAVFWRRPMEGNAWLYAAVEREPRLRPVPAVHPGLPGWEASLAEAADHGAPAVRSDLLRARPRRPRDAGARRRVRSGGGAAPHGGAARGRAPAPPRRSRARAAGGGDPDARAQRRRPAADRHPRRPGADRGGALRRDA